MDIVFYTEGLPFDGKAIEGRALGGSETAVACMARALARRGHGVTVYCHCPGPGVHEGVTYHDLAEFPRFAAEGRCEVLVASRFLAGMAASVRSELTVLWSHDVPTAEMAAGLRRLLWKVDGLFVLSQFHRGLYERALPECREALWVTRNGVDTALAAACGQGVGRERHRLLYTSRPERGLERLLEMWPALRRAEPRLTLGIAHYLHPAADERDGTAARLAAMAAELEGVSVLGPLAKPALYREMWRAGALAYPTHFPEVSCISALEAAACGLPVVTSRYGALKETVADGESGVLVPGDPDSARYQERFAGELLGLLGNDRRWEAMSRRARERAAKTDWGEVAGEWEEWLGRKLAARVRPGGKGREQGAFAKGRVAEAAAQRARGERRAQECPPYIEGSEGGHGSARPTPRQTLSVCMIVRDGGATLRRCLESVRPVADEVIVCDTGSRDDSVEVARRFADRVEEIEWPEDFAAARNRSIERARGDWILWIDADERLVGGEELRKYLRPNAYRGYIIRQHHFTVDAALPPDFPVRLFRNHQGIRFYGAIHEHPETALNAGVEPAAVLPDVHILHDGYATEAIRRQRFRRNLPLLLRDRELYPERRIGLVFLARDYLHLARYQVEEHGELTAAARRYLSKVVAIHRGHFMDPAAPFHEHSQPLYEQALAMLGEGFEAAVFLAVGRELPELGEVRPVRQRFLTAADLQQYLAGALERAQRELEPPLPFEEDEDVVCGAERLPADQRGADGGGDPGRVEHGAEPGDVPDGSG